MKAIIYNSGIGKRMGELTKNNPKSMVKLYNGETIFERQLRILSSCGIHEFVITTGPYEEQLREITKKPRFRHLTFHFVHNNQYATTNYIYSLYLARHLIDDDFLSLHGDLVFDAHFVRDLLKDKRENLCAYHPTRELPEKDFKGRFENGKLMEVSISIFDKNCYTFQPFYKLTKETFLSWIHQIEEYIEIRHIDTVYAENALNEITSSLEILPFSYENYYVEEIDNVDDYNRVSHDIIDWDYKEQYTSYHIRDIPSLFEKNGITHPFVVMDSFLLTNQDLNEILSSYHPIYFSSFQVNPLMDDVKKAKELFLSSSCDGILSIGGGSAIDVAKVLKLLLGEEDSILKEHEKCVGIAHIAIPTTAGTGSESTKHAVVYENGKKQSICYEQNLPDAIILDARFLSTLPFRQKRATYLDALCQAIESMWSMKADENSTTYSTWALRLLIENKDDYFANHCEVDGLILQGANFSGKAIHRTSTTAAHAMSYALTHEFHIPHGEAVAMCLPGVWKKLLEHKEKHTRNLDGVFQILMDVFHANSIEETLKKYESFLDQLQLKCEVTFKENDLDMLTNSVNLLRLSNFPYPLTKEEIREIYRGLVQK